MIALMPAAETLANDLMSAVVPPKKLRTAEWFCENLYTADGKPFREQMVPWVTAPNGPCDAIDSPNIQEVWLQWASRLFKTTFGQGVMMMYADVDPCEMMFATVDETLLKQIFGRYWKMLDNCPPLRDQLPPEKLRNKTHIELLRSLVYGAYPRGHSRLADKGIRVGHGNEVPKWEHQTTSSEGDPLRRFLKRGDQYPDRKFILEGTPTVKNRCRVERGRLKSSNCLFNVPCPHCGWFAPLVKGDGKEPPGIFWEKRDGGRSDADLAQKTAHYVCGHCQDDIRDIHRPEMMWRGVWVPEGCGVDHDKAIRARELPPDDRSWLTGTPAREGRLWGSQLSVLYALFHGWGDIAARWIDVQKRPQELRAYINEDMGETWAMVKREHEWEGMGKQIIVQDVKRLVVPEWATLVTVGIDKQQDVYPFATVAWGPGRRPAVIDYGEHDTLEDVQREVIDKQYQHADGGAAVKPCYSLVDSGYKPHGVYEDCKQCIQSGRQVWPCKGSPAALGSDYKLNKLGKDTSMPGMVLCHVDTIRTQGWIEQVLSISPDDGGLSLFESSIWEHQDFLEQILNDGDMADVDGAKGDVREKWERIDTTVPNDLRDCVRYAYVAMLIATRGKEIRPRGAVVKTLPAVISAGVGRPDGGPWVRRR